MPNFNFSGGINFSVISTRNKGNLLISSISIKDPTDSFFAEARDLDLQHGLGLDSRYCSNNPPYSIGFETKGPGKDSGISKLLLGLMDYGARSGILSPDEVANAKIHFKIQVPTPQASKEQSSFQEKNIEWIEANIPKSLGLQPADINPLKAALTVDALKAVYYDIERGKYSGAPNALIINNPLLKEHYNAAADWEKAAPVKSLSFKEQNTKWIEENRAGLEDLGLKDNLENLKTALNPGALRAIYYDIAKVKPNGRLTEGLVTKHYAAADSWEKGTRQGHCRDRVMY